MERHQLNRLNDRRVPSKRKRQNVAWLGVWNAIVATVLICNGGCFSSGPTADPEQPKTQEYQVFAANYALKYLTERIAGSEISVACPPPATANPRMWKPSVDDVAAMQRADLIVVNGPGADYAQWLVQVTLPESKLCNTCQSFKIKDFISVKDYRIVHSHGPEGEHSHPFFVPYPWLDPKLAGKQAEKIASALKLAYPSLSSEFEQNLKNLQSDLEDLAAEIAETESSETVLLAHPMPKFLTRAAGAPDIHLLWFEWPTDETWEERIKEFEQRTENQDLNTILASSPPTNRVQEFLDKRGYSVIQIDLLDHPPHEGDFLTALRANFKKLSADE